MSVPLVEKFIRTQLKEGGVEDPKSVKIKIRGDTWNSRSVLTYREINIPLCDGEDRLLELLIIKKYYPEYLKNHTVKINYENGKSITISAAEYLRETAATIHHEAAHIINRDNMHISAIFCASLYPLILIRYKIRSSSNVVKAALATLPCTYLVYHQNRQFQERRADDNVKDNIHLLRAYKRSFERDLFLNEEFYKQNEQWNKRLISTHPHPKVRIKNLKQRIKALKEKSDPKAFEDPLAIKEDGQITYGAHTL